MAAAGPALDWILPAHGISGPDVLALGRAGEVAGIDGLWVPDHLLNVTRPEAGVLECWTLLSALAASTRRVPIGPLILATPFRAPALLAKQAGTLASLAPGRLRLGLGAGGMTYAEACAQLGFAPLSAGARVEQVRETVECLQVLWRDDPAHYRGRFARAEGARIHPRPELPVPLVVAARGPRMLRMLATCADGWNCPLPHELEAGLRTLAEAGRTPQDLEVSVFAIGVLGVHEQEARAALQRAGPAAQWFGDVERHHVFGGPDRAAERIAALAAQGAHRITLDLRGHPPAEALSLLMEEVSPRLGR